LLNKIYNNSKAFESTFAINSSSTAGEADEYVKYISDVNIGKKIINTGTISPYRSLWGEKEYSNKKEKIMKPYLDLNIASERRKKMYDSKKVIFPKLSKRLYAVIDAKGEFASTNTTFIYGLSDTSVKVIGALVNSSLYDFIYKSIFSGLNLLGSFQFQAPQIRLLPYKEVTDCTLKTMVVIVDQILMLKNQNKDADTKNLESQIDQLVYKLYDLTPEEIEIVENSLK